MGILFGASRLFLLIYNALIQPLGQAVILPFMQAERFKKVALGLISRVWFLVSFLVAITTGAWVLKHLFSGPDFDGQPTLAVCSLIFIAAILSLAVWGYFEKLWPEREVKYWICTPAEEGSKSRNVEIFESAEEPGGHWKVRGWIPKWRFFGSWKRCHWTITKFVVKQVAPDPVRVTLFALTLKDKSGTRIVMDDRVPTLCGNTVDLNWLLDVFDWNSIAWAIQGRGRSGSLALERLKILRDHISGFVGHKRGVKSRQPDRNEAHWFERVLELDESGLGHSGHKIPVSDLPALKGKGGGQQQAKPRKRPISTGSSD